MGIMELLKFFIWFLFICFFFMKYEYREDLVFGIFVLNVLIIVFRVDEIVFLFCDFVFDMIFFICFYYMFLIFVIKE